MSCKSLACVWTHWVRDFVQKTARRNIVKKFRMNSYPFTSSPFPFSQNTQDLVCEVLWMKCKSFRRKELLHLEPFLFSYLLILQRKYHLFAWWDITGSLSEKHSLLWENVQHWTTANILEPIMSSSCNSHTSGNTVLKHSWSFWKRLSTVNFKKWSRTLGHRRGTSEKHLWLPIGPLISQVCFSSKEWHIYYACNDHELQQRHTLHLNVQRHLL